MKRSIKLVEKSYLEFKILILLLNEENCSFAVFE